MDRSACGNWQRFTMRWVGLSVDGRAQTTAATAATTSAATAAQTETGSAAATATATTAAGAEGGANDYSR